MDKFRTDLAMCSIVTLVKEHKKICNSEDCDVMTHVLGELVEEMLGRELTTEEWKIFI
jgi:hypothetical protein